jgi:hypothetical protein
MNKLRLPGSWKTGVQSVAGAAAAVFASSVWGLYQRVRDASAGALDGLLAAVVVGGALTLGAALAAWLLHRRGRLEFLGEEEEERLRARTSLLVREAGEPVRGPAPPAGRSSVPAHVKVLTGFSIAVWCVILPWAHRRDVPYDVTVWLLYALFVPVFAAGAAYAVHAARGAVGIVKDASED